MSADFSTILYSVAGPVATVTLNRPERLNTIVPPLPDEVEAAVGTAVRDAQLAAMKLVVNHAYENMGPASTQTLGPILDGLMRNMPDALSFIDEAARSGVGAVVRRRDGPFGDYGQAPEELRPDPGNVIEP
jgi:enoyl-CoA hydratase